ncbi:NAD(P)H-dependent oxidoreductase [Maricaulaceae bacterium NA33B04]|nr:NAD(P)H-dependent oxidoreductase [Maricaulaceae bacterium NA33B04]
MTRILHIDASARTEGSVSRDLSTRLVRRLADADGEITRRDLSEGGPAFLDADWVGATFKSPDARSNDQLATLAPSDVLVDELEAADHIVIGTPIYNFAVPAVLKAWIDQVARVHRTFVYTDTGPKGLLDGKTAWIVVASGGTPVDSEIDFATPYLRHIFGFMGITDVRVIDAGRWGFLSDEEKAGVIAQAEGEQAKAA